MNNYQNNESKVDYGLTTGSLATATSLASLKKIINPEMDICSVKITTPFDEFDVDIENSELLAKNKAKSIAIKYPYNDPDVTVNLEITSSVELLDLANFSNENFDSNENIIIEGGIGIGTVTKPGLQISKGNSAINPVPLKMIKENLKPLVPKDKIAKIIISAPEGEKIAKKTMNPKLGIVGGISILGTTGIARAMSNKAYKDSLLCQLDIASAMISKGIYSKNSLIFVPGNIGEKIALNSFNINNSNENFEKNNKEGIKEYINKYEEYRGIYNKGIKKDQIIQMGNFPGFMFKESKKRGIDNFILFGHIGKLIKIAGGIFNTKHSIADCRREIMAAHAGLIGAKKDTIRLIFNSKTTEEMIDILKNEDIDVEVLNSISLAIKKRCLENFDIDVKVILVDMEGNLLNSNI